LTKGITFGKIAGVTSNMTEVAMKASKAGGKRRATFNLSATLIADIDAAARKTGLKKSTIIERAAGEWLAKKSGK